MIEPIMYFGIGFLFAALIGLVVIPLVHARAVRLTMLRLEAATPLSMAEIQADKDQLRAEFAMSTRRLEMSVEQLKSKTTSQLAELGKKSDAINRLKIELGEKTATIFALEARDKALRDQLRATEDEVAAKTTAMHQAQRALSDKKGELLKAISALEEKSSFSEAQKVEIIALKTQVEALKDRLTAAGNELKLAEGRREAERHELRAATDELEEERGKVQNLARRIGDLEQHLAAQTTEAELLGRRAADLEARLSEQSRLLTEAETNLKHLHGELEKSRKTESDLGAAIAEMDQRASSATESLKAEKAHLQAEYDRTREERDRLAAELGNIKREAEEAWQSERMENALLRERINDVAAEVARLASALEGPNSPIEAILAEAARPLDAETAANGEVDAGAGKVGNGNLADRIRALQSQASRVQRADKPSNPN